MFTDVKNIPQYKNDQSGYSTTKVDEGSDHNVQCDYSFSDYNNTCLYVPHVPDNDTT